MNLLALLLALSSTIIKYAATSSDFPYVASRYAIANPTKYYILQSTDTLLIIITDKLSTSATYPATTVMGIPLYIATGELFTTTDPANMKTFSNAAAQQALALYTQSSMCKLSGSSSYDVVSMGMDTSFRGFAVLPGSYPTTTYVRAYPVFKRGIGVRDTIIASNPSTTAYVFYNAKNTCARYIYNSSFVNQFPWVYRINGSPDATACSSLSLSACQTCAWPYDAVPDSSGCGCKVSTTNYQSSANLQAQCYAYCNSNSINGNQAYFDASRSNFDGSKGVARCVCSDPVSKVSIRRPTGTCPKGTSATSVPVADTTNDAPAYDPSDTTGSGSGSGSGSGLDSASKAHLSRLDSILGDTALGKKFADSAMKGDTNGSGFGTGSGKFDSSKGRDSVGKIGTDTSSGATLGGNVDTSNMSWTQLDTSFEINIMGKDTVYADSTGTYLNRYLPSRNAFAILLKILLTIALWPVCWSIASGGSKDDV